MPMLTLDLPTVLFLYSSSLLAGTLAMLYVWHHNRNRMGLGFIALAFAMLATGGALASVTENNLLPWPGFWLYIHFSLGIGGYAILWLGLAALSSHSWRRYRIIAFIIPILWLLSGIWSGFVMQNTLRAAAFHFNSFFFLLAAAFCIWQDRHIEPLCSRWLLSLILLGSALLYGGECYWILAGAWTVQEIAWAFFAQIICNFSLVLFVLTMLSERAAFQLKQASERDELTGIGNRRFLFARLPPLAQPGSAIIMIDVDHFKRANDTFGHLGGDRLLAVTAQTLQRVLRAVDVMARFGGEEFVVFLPDISTQDAREMAERLRCEAAAQEIDLGDARYKVTISIGLVCLDQPGRSWDEWIKLADAACYQAKQQGRNRVCQHQAATVAP